MLQWGLIIHKMNELIKIITMTQNRKLNRQKNFKNVNS